MFQAKAYILPDIEAHQFKVTPIEKSRTGRVYRFKVDAEQLPKTGNILLIEENGKPTLAFRVLNTDSKLNQFVGKRVRRYDTTSELKINENYQAAEKIADLVSPPPLATVAKTSAPPMLDPVPAVTATQAPVAAAPVMGDTTPPPPPELIAKKTEAEVPALPELPENKPEAAPVVAANDSALDAPAASKNLTVDQYDDSLDSGTDPNVMADGSDSSAGEYEDDIVVKERTIINPFKYMLGLSVGTYKNLTNGVFTYPSSGGFSLSFSHVVQRGWLFKKQMPQDSLSLEYGFTYYSRISINNHNDDYTFVPLKVELRYDIHLSELFSPFIYAGVQYNLIAATTNVDRANSNIDATTYSNLGGFQPNFGIGILYTIGPQWYLRADAGIDRFAVGLNVKW